MELVLAVVTDLHFGPEARWNGKLRKLTAHAGDLTRAFVERARAVKPDFVVNLGDDIEDEGLEADRARYAECQRILKSAGAPVVNVVGNHDDVNLASSDLLSIWGGTGRDGPDGKLYGSFDAKGFHVVVLHTHEQHDVDITVEPEQLAWLEQDLAKSPRPTIVLMHHSASDMDLSGNRWFEGGPHRCLVRQRRAIRKLLRAHGDVRCVLNGHLHWNHLDVIGGLPFVTVQSLIENLDDDAPGRAAAAHAIVRITNKRVVIEVEGAETARYQFQSEARVVGSNAPEEDGA